MVNMSFRMCVDAVPQHAIYQHHPKQNVVVKLPVAESKVAEVVNAEDVPVPALIEEHHLPEEAPVVLKIQRNKKPELKK